jgi:hypothetical protein
MLMHRLSVSWRLAGLVALCGLMSSARAQDKPDLPPAKDLVAKHVEAVGGKAAILKHKSSHSKGKFSLPAQGVDGNLEVHAAAPNKLAVKVAIDAFGEFTQGFDGKVGWSNNPMTGAQLVEGKQLDDMKERAEFHGETKDEERYKSMETVGVEQFEGQECYKVKLVRKSGGEQTRYYDKKTGLLVGTLGKRETPMGEVEVKSVLSDYKEFDGVKVATKVRQTLGEMEQVLTISSVEYDKVADSAFDLPAAVKDLIKK